MTTTIRTALSEDYIAPIRQAADLARFCWSADAEHDCDHITMRNWPATKPSDPDRNIIVTGLGALVLGHFVADDEDLPEEPLDFSAGSVEGYTGFHAVPLVALYLAVNHMADPHDFTAETISEWCQAEDRTAEQVADMLTAAADAIADGTLPIFCSSSLCTKSFGWGVPLRHEQTSGKTTGEVLAEHRGSWLIVHDGRAVCPRDNRMHRQIREERLVGATAALFAPMRSRRPR